MEEPFEILNLTPTSNDIAEIFCSDGNSFYIRYEYLELVERERIKIGEQFSTAEKDDILNAALSFAAEIQATQYLERAEQCRFKLKQKLLQKNLDKSSIEKALDYLEKKNYLSDERYASAWLRDHSIGKFQGRTRLLAELLSRGIKNSIAKQALDSFFEENSEQEFCKKAYEKAVRQGKKGDRLLKYMLDSGFSKKLIADIITPSETPSC